MTNEERIAELEMIVRAQSRLLCRLLGDIHVDELAKEPLGLTQDEGRELLDYALADVPNRIRHKYFHDALDDYDLQCPLPDQP